MNIDKVKKAKEDYEQSRLEVAKKAYETLKFAINAIQRVHDGIDIDCHWNGFISVGGHLYHQAELDEEF